MSHGGTESGDGSSDGGGWKWRFLFVLGVAALGFGAWGMYLYEISGEHHHADLSSVLYHTLQLFLLHAPHLEKEIPWQLHLGRWLAAIVALVAVFKAIARVFRSECQMFWLWRGKHVVVCGLGQVGLPLAFEFKRQQKVVAIESAVSAAVVQARAAGIIVLIGDACTEEFLKRARVDKAAHVLAVCSDDQTNVAIAARISQLLGKKSAVLHPACWLFVKDKDVRATLQAGEFLPQVKMLREIDLHDLAARQAFNDMEHTLDRPPLAEGAQTRVHLVLVGFGRTGQALAMQAARTGHFANGKKLIVTIIEDDCNQRFADFDQYNVYEKEICDVRRINTLTLQTPLLDTLASLCPASANDEVVTFAICKDAENLSHAEQAENPLGVDDFFNLPLSVNLARHQKVRDCEAKVLVCLSRRCGFATLLEKDQHEKTNNLHAIGMLEDLCSRKALLDEEQDKAASVIHERYLRHLAERRKKDPTLPKREAEVAWELLAETYRSSNRYAADHMQVKLRAVRCNMETPGSVNRVLKKEFTHREKELLSRMEHRRWMAEKWLDGCKYGAVRDDAKKLHPDLIDWAPLPLNEKQIDHELVEVIFEVAAETGRVVYQG